MQYKTVSIVRVCNDGGHCNNVLYVKGTQEVCNIMITTVAPGIYLVQCSSGDIEQTCNSESELEDFINKKFSLHSSSECFSCHTTMQLSVDQFGGKCEKCGYDLGLTHCLHEWCPKCCCCVTVKRVK